MRIPLGLVGGVHVNTMSLASILLATGAITPSGVNSPVLSAATSLVLQPATVHAVTLI